MSDQSGPPRSLQVSLRTFLIAVLGAGLTLGILGQLCRRQPEIFTAVISGLSTIVPFLLAIGTVLWVGYHRSPVWSLPVCATCRNDLRWFDLSDRTNCPRCGADLTASQGVAFVRGGYRSGRIIVWGMMLLLMPLFGFGGLILFRMAAGPSPQGLGLVSNQEVIQQRLLPQVDQPWVWQELERRLAAGKLSQQEVDDAVNILIGHMKASKPNGWDQPFSWQGGFLKAASSAGLISDPVLIALCDAFYGPEAKIRSISRTREDSDNLRIDVGYGSNWNNHFGAGVELLWEVQSVRLGDKRLDIRQLSKTDNEWMGLYEGPLPAGEHKLSVEIDCAYVDTAQLAGLNIRELPAARWPEDRKRWKQTLSAKCKVYTKDEPILKLVSDPERDPARTGGIQVNRFAVQDDRSGKKRIRLSVSFSEILAVPISFDVAVKLADKTISLHHLFAARESGWSTSSGNQLEAQLDAIDAAVRQADIILTPNPKHIESIPQVTEIWGETIVLPQVPLERLDLAVEGESSPK